MSHARFAAVVIAAVIVLFAGGNLISDVLLRGVRADFTERGLYALSPGARTVIDRLDEPVDLTFYYSRTEAARYPGLRAYAARVRELLRTMTARSRGMIRLDEVDPEPFSEAEDAAITAGLEPISGDAGGRIFFGLVGRNAVDDERMIGFFDPADEARLEYELVRVIAQLERARIPSIAVISDLPFEPDGEGDSANPVIDELAGAFDVRWLDAGFEAIPDVDALFLLHPPPLSEGQTYLVDQFALSRGRVLVAVDPLAHVALKPGPDGVPPVQAQRASDLPRLLAAWGVRYDPTVAVMDRAHGLPVQVVEDGRARTRAYPLWFAAPPAGLSAESPATAALARGINFGSPGLLTPAEGADTAFEPLVRTSPDGARLDVDIAAGSPGPAELLAGYAPDDDAPLTLAARVSGALSTAYPDGPPAGEIAFEPSDHLSASAGPGEVVVIADADWLDPAYYLRSDPVDGGRIVADNPALALNLADRLAGDPALVSLRSRSSSARPMTRVEALRAEAEARYLEVQRELEAELEAARERLEELNAAGESSVLGGASRDEAAEAEQLRARMVEARARLREVERGFRREIDALERALVFWTMWAPPLGVALLGAIFLFLRRRGAP
ncbi:hypothetical protein DDZ18_02775 [Marinicauda salina]|uniref:Uncharacterized protein n=1 Tax=Marinicauda salina TaxID=2135793 RepID=A0A2U2BX05_9PROT|nr:Gldg family protein [Marinicauda salina]PWE18545.1 hypothetical protein DDZ18_02775 [Marinicauda salina]